MKLFKGRKGFTLIELLVVILILAILLAIAMPLYLRAVADSEKRTCQSNMQTIATAVQAYRVHHASHQYPADLTALTTPDAAGDPVDLQAVPVCPNAGTYSVVYEPSGSADPADPTTVTGFHINCTTHGDFTPSVVG